MHQAGQTSSSISRPLPLSHCGNTTPSCEPHNLTAIMRVSSRSNMWLRLQACSIPYIFFFFFFCFFSPFLFLPTTICRIDADHYEITYAKGKAKCGLATWDFLRFPREKGGMKQEPFWNTHNRGLDIFHNYTICKCVAFLVLLLKRYCNSKGI